MRLTKDEARILGNALASAKYNWANNASQSLNRKIIESISELQAKLEAHGKDERRTGRVSADHFSDCLERFANKKQTQP